MAAINSAAKFFSVFFFFNINYIIYTLLNSYIFSYRFNSYQALISIEVNINKIIFLCISTYQNSLIEKIVLLDPLFHVQP